MDKISQVANLNFETSTDVRSYHRTMLLAGTIQRSRICIHNYRGQKSIVINFDFFYLLKEQFIFAGHTVLGTKQILVTGVSSICVCCPEYSTPGWPTLHLTK